MAKEVPKVMSWHVAELGAEHVGFRVWFLTISLFSRITPYSNVGKVFCSCINMIGTWSQSVNIQLSWLFWLRGLSHGCPRS